MSLNKQSTGQQLVTALAATGNNQATALQLAGRESFQEVTTVGSGAGVMFPALTQLPAVVTICNQGLNTLSIYPRLGGTIDNGSVNAAATLPAGKAAVFEASSLTNWYTVASTATSGGSVTSVTFTGDGTVLSSTPSAAVTASGTVAATLASQSANLVLAGPSTGSPAAPTFRAIVPNDFSTEAANQVLAGPASGSAATPTFRALASADTISALSGFFFGTGQTFPTTQTITTTITLTADTYYSNLTISGSGVLKTAGWRVFVAGTLDISGAGAGAIQCNGGNGSNSTSATGGAAGGVPYTSASSTVGTVTAPSAGANGSTTAGGAGAAVSSQAVLNLTGSNGAATGAAGAGTGGGGGAAIAGCNTSQAPYPYRYIVDTKSPFTILAGLPGSSGSGGGGDGTNSGGGGGGGGASGGWLQLYAYTIARGSNSTAGIIQAKGGNGGNGGNGVAGNSGGGAGGAGGGGGSVMIDYAFLTGSTIAGAIDVTGGNGGNGGSLVGSGSANGTGGGGGPGGYVLLYNIATGTFTEFKGAGRVAPPSTGTTAGNSATAAQQQAL